MNSPMSFPSAAKLPHQLLTASQVKVLLTVGDPDYGRDFTPEEWDAIAERLSALTRLLYRIRKRQLMELQNKEQPALAGDHQRQHYGA